MKNYALFYNRAFFGDLLMISFDGKAIPTSKIQNGDFVKIYRKDELIGVNIFNFQKYAKIHADGLIPLPANALIDLINTILSENEIETLEYKNKSGFVIGKIISCEQHEESDHLHVLKVDIGSEILDIVCGAYNVAIGENVVVATIGTTMFDGSIIEKGNLLGVDSYGMCCSEKELNLTKDQTKHGLLLLDENVKIGQDFFSLN
jgi:tRNA-binding protein